MDTNLPEAPFNRVTERLTRTTTGSLFHNSENFVIKSSDLRTLMDWKHKILVNDRVIPRPWMPRFQRGFQRQGTRREDSEIKMGIGAQMIYYVTGGKRHKYFGGRSLCRF